MKKVFTFGFVILFGLVGLAYGQSAKDVYKAVKKAELKFTLGSRNDFANAVADAKVEVESFSQTAEAKRNPVFTMSINGAIDMFMMASQVLTLPKVSGSADSFDEFMNLGRKDLKMAEQCLKSIK